MSDRARKLHAPWIGKPRARWKRAVPGTLANEWRPKDTKIREALLNSSLEVTRLQDSS